MTNEERMSTGMLRRYVVPLLAAASLFLSACGQPAAQAPAAEDPPAPAPGAPIRVVASTSIIGDVVGQIGGERVAVTTLVPIGGDTHSFSPSPQDIARVAEAQLVFVNGAG
jgi:ABC-type Zn uptake system ZnuABC Zn-binding protein ZnuA